VLCGPEPAGPTAFPSAAGREYVAKIATRAYSDLECLSGKLYGTGLDALWHYADACPDFPRLAENDVFVFVASSASLQSRARNLTISRP
jgi:hypothetical protein